MKHKHICFAVFVMSFAMLVSCTNTSVPTPSLSPHQTSGSTTVTLPEVAPHYSSKPSETEIASFEKVEINDKIHSTYISAPISEPKILVNGEPTDSESMLFEQDGFYYLPAEDIANYFGDYYTFNETDSIATIWCPDIQRAAYYEIGEPRYTVWSNNDGDWQHDWYEVAYINGYPIQGSAAPIMKNGVVYLPAGFFSFSSVSWVEEQNAIVLAHSQVFDFVSSLTFTPGNLFSAIPDDLKQSFVQTVNGKEWPGETATPNPVLYNRYENEDLQIDTTYWDPALRPNEPDLGIEYVRSITLLSDKYATARGLRLGDSGTRFELLYGYPITKTEDGSYISTGDSYGYYLEQGGSITLISFSTRLDQVALKNHDNESELNRN